MSNKLEHYKPNIINGIHIAYVIKMIWEDQKDNPKMYHGGGERWNQKDLLNAKFYATKMSADRLCNVLNNSGMLEEISFLVKKIGVGVAR